LRAELTILSYVTEVPGKKFEKFHRAQGEGAATEPALASGRDGRQD